MRCTEMQLWPANANACAASFAAASSMSASGSTITGVALPSSRRTRFFGARCCEAPSRRAPEPGEGDQLTRSSSTSTSPISDAGPTTTFSQPGGSPASSSSSASRSADSGVWVAGLSTTGASRRERGRDLVRDEVQREVERADRADDADRAPQREGELALAGLAGVHRDHLAGELPRLDGGERVRRHRAHRLDARGLHRLAGLVGDLPRDLVVAPAERGGDAHEDLGALVRRQRLPHAQPLLRRVARLVSAAPAFATRPTTSPEKGERTSIHSPVSTHSPAISSFRSVAVVAMVEVYAARDAVRQEW